MGADPLSSSALLVVLLAVVGYALYWIIRRAVAAGIRDAAHLTRQPQERVDR